MQRHSSQPGDQWRKSHRAPLQIRNSDQYRERNADEAQIILRAAILQTRKKLSSGSYRLAAFVKSRIHNVCIRGSGKPRKPEHHI